MAFLVVETFKFVGVAGATTGGAVVGGGVAGGCVDVGGVVVGGVVVGGCVDVGGVVVGGVVVGGCEDVGGVVVGGVVVGGVVVGGVVVGGVVVGGVVVGGVVVPSVGSRKSIRFGEKAPGFETRSREAIVRRREDTSEGESDGNTESSTAAAPATCGVAIDVPDIVADAEFDEIPAERTLTPGAKISTQEPKLEKEARASLAETAATVSAAAALAGDERQASTFELPAATATVTPSATTRAIASSRTCDAEPPSERFTTAGTPAT
jgi:hypothetical protein